MGKTVSQCDQILAKQMGEFIGFFKYPEPIRRVMYTTNTIEAIHRQFRKLTKTKGGFPNQNSLLKLLYVGIKNASRKWTMTFPDWNLTLSQLMLRSVIFVR
ncbi:mutator family transposase [Nitrosomonas aestuarii]|nr:transposase [Nitrosomonas aestuarii]PTN12085.1 mutator family transposase [Nitrosomonas aestuarii]